MVSSSRLSKFITVALPILSIAIVGSMGSVLFNTSHAAELTTSSTPISVPAPSANLPTSVTADCCTVRVNKLTRPTADAGRVTLNVSITNSLHAALQISPGLQMILRDTSGKIYNYTASYLPVNVTVGGPLSGGATRTEDIDFVIPVSAVPQSLTFQLDASSTPVTIGVPS